MKNIGYRFKLWAALPVVAVLAAGCSEFLSTTPEDFFTDKDYYETTEHFENALTAVYDVLGQGGLYGSAMFSRMATEGDEGYYARDKITGPQIYSFSSSDDVIETMWRTLYLGINRANDLLSRIDASAIPDADKTRIRGEALFLRAYYYFLLVQHWGDVPLILTPTKKSYDTGVERTPKEKVYARILKDMEEAEAAVKDISQIGHGGRVSKSAVRGILARVCLYMAGEAVGDRVRYLDARDWCLEVMNDTAFTHSLNPDYPQIFINYAKDLYDIGESIWEVEFWGNLTDAYTETGKVGAWIGIQYGWSDGVINPSYGYINATGTHYNRYEAGDLRRDWCIAPFKYEKGGGRILHEDTEEKHWTRNVGKWRREYEVLKNTTYNSSQNFPLLRYSDVLLMFAEAENHINNGPDQAAYDAVNQVRRRAFGKLMPGAESIEAHDLSGLDYAGFLEAIRKERTRELCFEALRKQDLIRWGIFVPSLRTVATEINFVNSKAFYAIGFRNVSAKHLLYPIPSHDMALNKSLIQNPNW